MKSMMKIKHLMSVAVLAAALIVFPSCDKKDPVVVPPEEEQEQEHKGSSLDISGKVMDTDGNPYEGAVVSDGITFVKTDVFGRYEFTRSRYASFITCSIPADAEITMDGNHNLPQSFFQKVSSSKKVYDFTYKRIDVEKRFRIVAIGDPQVNSTARVDVWKGKALPDLRQFYLSEEKIPTYGISAGDNVQNDNSYLTIIADAYGQIGFPIFSTIGNHDHDHSDGMITDEDRVKGYEAVFGPSNFSFNRGDVHIVIMDDIIYPDNSTDYTTGVDDAKFEWLKKDLSFVSSDKRVLLSWHAPMSSSSFQHKQDILNLLAGFKVANIIDGHTHNVEHDYDHKVNGKLIEDSAVGSTGAPFKGDFLSDGCNRCYLAYEYNGTDITRIFCKSIGFDNSHQMRLYRTSEFGPYTTALGYSYTFPADYCGKEWIAANVYNHKNGRWTYELWEDGVKTSTAPVAKKSIDPWVKRVMYENNNVESEIGANNHMLFFKLKNPDAKEIKIVAKDSFGGVYTEDKFQGPSTILN